MINQTNQTALLNSMGHKRNKLQRKEGMLVSKKIVPTLKEDPPGEVLNEDATGYTILRSLPGYNIGDSLRKEDLTLCCSKEATAFAMNKLLPNDCAFILRSDGSFTYAIYQGRATADAPMLFRVDEQGSSKKVSVSKFCQLVKVAAVAVPVRRASRATRTTPLSRSLISNRGRMASRKNKTPLSSSMLPIKTSRDQECPSTE